MCFVMVQGARIVAALDLVFAPNIFPRSLQIIMIEFSIHSLSLWNKFRMLDAEVGIILGADFTAMHHMLSSRNRIHRHMPCDILKISQTP
jgi:hypothetical protein